MRVRFSLLAAGLLAGCFATTPAPVPTPSASGSAAAPSGITTVPVGGAPIGLVGAGSLIYTAIEGSAILSLIDTRNLDPAGRFDLGDAKPTIMRTFLDRRQILAIDEARNELLVIDVGFAPVMPQPSVDPNKPRPTGTPPIPPSPSPSRPSVLHRIPIGEGVSSLALGEDNLTVLLAADQAGMIELLTFPEDRRLPPASKKFPLGGAAATGAHDLIDLKDGKWLAPRVDRLYCGDLVGGVPKDMGAFGAGGSVAFGTVAAKPVVAIATDPTKDAIVLIDLATGTPTTLTDAGKGPREIALDPSKKRAYVSMGGSNEVAVIDYEAKKVVTRVPVGKGPGGVTLAAPLPNEIWVTSDDDQLAVIDGAGAEPKVRLTRPLGKGPHRMTFWGTNGYVSNQADGTVSVIDRNTLR